MNAARTGVRVAALVMCGPLLFAACGSAEEAAPDPTVAPASSGADRSGGGTPSPGTSKPRTGASNTTATVPPPYIEGADWVDTDVGASLQIRPTRAGRDVVGDRVEDEAWREVLALHPDADTPGMRAQFDCHWTFARLVDPEKPSWNLEPGRPVVTEEQMIAARCNPGGPEEG